MKIVVEIQIYLKCETKILLKIVHHISFKLYNQLWEITVKYLQSNLQSACKEAPILDYFCLQAFHCPSKV